MVGGSAKFMGSIQAPYVETLDLSPLHGVGSFSEWKHDERMDLPVTVARSPIFGSWFSVFELNDLTEQALEACFPRRHVPVSGRVERVGLTSVQACLCRSCERESTWCPLHGRHGAGFQGLREKIVAKSLSRDGDCFLERGE